jgi:hypothetical protein
VKRTRNAMTGDIKRTLTVVPGFALPQFAESAGGRDRCATGMG